MVAVLFEQIAQGADDQGRQSVRLFNSYGQATKYLENKGYKKYQGGSGSNTYTICYGFHDEYSATLISEVTSPGFAFSYIDLGD